MNCYRWKINELNFQSRRCKPWVPPVWIFSWCLRFGVSAFERWSQNIAFVEITETENETFSGLNEKCLDALSYETLHRKNSLKKLCKMTSEHGRLLVINRPDNNDSCLLKKIAHFSIKLYVFKTIKQIKQINWIETYFRSNSTEVIDIRGKQSMEVIESFANKLNSNKSSRNELKLLILKNVDKFILDDENKMNYALLGNVLFQEPKLVN